MAQYIEFEFKVKPLQPAVDILQALLAEVGFEMFQETETGLNAYVQEELLDEEGFKNIDFIHANEEYQIQWTRTNVKSQNWNEEWEKNYEPVIVDQRCMVRAPFHEALPGLLYDIVIEPKMSFGTGHHATTWLVLNAMLEEDFTGKEVLDMGCGSAVLAVLAAMKGAKSILAIDNDEWAYENSVENVARNNVSSQIDVKLGDATLLNDQRFDIVLANINRNIILRDWKEYLKVLKPGGSIYTSGYLVADAPLMKEEAEKLGLALQNSNSRDNWQMMVFKKN